MSGHTVVLRQNRPSSGGVKVCGSLGLLYKRLPKSSLAECRSLEGLDIDGNPLNLPPVKGMHLSNYGRA